MYSKTLNTQDYENLTDEVQHIENMNSKLANTAHRFEHPHRRWEYGLSMKIIRENAPTNKKNKKKILDVGGGGSVFAPAMQWVDYDVIQVDPGNCYLWVKNQSAVIQQEMTYHQVDFFGFDSEEKYDVVTCLSVIEHVEEDKKFFKKLLSFVKNNGLLILTTDFHPEGTRQVDGHIKTYNEKTIMEFVDIAKSQGFELLNDSYDYNHFEPNVNTYTFASLVLKKNNVKKTTRTRRKSTK